MKMLLTGVLCLCFSQSEALFGQTDSISRGAYLFGATEVNLLQLHDTLGFNTVELNTGWVPSWEDTVMNNTHRVAVYTQRRFLADQSKAQHVIYEAEQGIQPSKMHNYFVEHPKGSVSDDAWVVVPGTDTQGWIVGSPWPNDDYHYGQTSYTATFTLKTAGSPVPTRSAVRCEVWVNGTRVNYLDLRAFDLSATSYRDFALSFSLPSGESLVASTSSGVLTGGMGERVASKGRGSAVAAAAVDLRVWWYGGVTIFLDKITVDDDSARVLFAHTNDAAIRRSAADSCVAYPAHERFYLVDEPFLSAFQGFGYVAGQIRAVPDINQEKAGSLTATYQYHTRFLNEAQPSQLMNDSYFLYNHIPHPSVIDAGLAEDYGFEPWNAEAYADSLQYYIDMYLPSYQETALASQALGKRWLIVPQLHEIFYQSTGKYQHPGGALTLRPPAPTEIRLQVNLGLVYGAHGYLAFPYGTGCPTINGDSVAIAGLVSNRKRGIYCMDHSSNTEMFYGVDTWTGYREKFDEVKAINMRLKSIGDTLLALNWLATKSWSSSNHTTGTWGGLVTSAAAKSYSGTALSTPYVETGHFQHALTGVDYLMVFNRRCAPSDSLFVTLTLEDASLGAIKVTDIERDTSWTVISGGSFTDLLHPGEMKVYRLDQGLVVTVSGPQTLEPSETGTFVATTVGGISPMHYEWWFYDECSGLVSPDAPMQPPCGQWNSSRIYGSEFPHQNETDFKVYCTVTDAAGREATSHYHYVTVGTKLAKRGNQDNAIAALPERYSLEPPYPNPFNPSTTLRLALPEDATVRLRVFDVVGRQVASLVEGSLQAGYHDFIWKAQTLSSGPYFAQAEVRDKDGRVVLSAIHKLLLTK
jgi:hypothetical protein